jgi:uncharacterized protein YyaL (SSP411 family)
MVCDGQLLRTYRSGGAGRLPGYLDDYAEVSRALLNLYEANFDHRRLAAADQLVGRMLAEFWDERHDGFYYTSATQENLLVRTKPFYDGPVPSGNSTAALVLLRLSKLLDKPNYFSKAEKLLESTVDGLQRQPRAHLRLLCAADFYRCPTREIAIAGRRDGDDTRSLLKIIRQKFIPNKILALADPNADSEPIEPAIPLLAGKQMLFGKAAVYLCENFSCKQPVTDVNMLEKAITGFIEPN